MRNRRRGLAGAPLALLAALALLAGIAASLHTRDLDLMVYWKAAERTFDEGINPYSRREGDVLPFTYPPTALFLFYPLSRMDPEGAERLLWTMNLLLAALMLVLPVRDLARRDPEMPRDTTGDRLLLFGPLYVACYGGLYLTLVFHQVNLLLLICLWIYWRAVRRARQTPAAGVALALGAVAKPHYGLLLLSGLSGRPLPLLAGAAGAGVVLLVLSGAIAPAGSWSSWITEILGTTSYTELPPGHSSIAAPWNRAIPGEIARLMVPNKFTTPVVASPEAAAVISTLLALGIWAVSARALLRSTRSAVRGTRAVDLELSILSVAVFLTAPASWTHHLVMLLPAALVLLRDGVLDPAERPSSRFAAALVLAVIALTPDDLLPREVRLSSQPLMSLMTVGVFALWALLVQQLCRQTALDRGRGADGATGSRAE